MEVVGQLQLLADGGDFGHMSGWGWGWMIFGTLFWAIVIGLTVWVVSRNPRSTQPGVDAEAILAERFALGEISAEELAERREALRQ